MAEASSGTLYTHTHTHTRTHTYVTTVELARLKDAVSNTTQELEKANKVRSHAGFGGGGGGGVVKG